MFACGLQKSVLRKSERLKKDLASLTLPWDFIKTEKQPGRFPRNISTFFCKSYFTKRLWVTTLKGFYFFSEPNNHYFVGWTRGTVTTLLEKYCFENTVVVFARSVHPCSKGCSGRFYKIHKKGSLIKPNFGWVVVWNSTEKELHRSCFPMTFSKFFRIAILWNTGEQLLLKG